MVVASQQDRYQMSIAENVKQLRIRKGLSQKALADLVGVSHPRISDLERGKSNPTLSTLTTLADCLGTTLEMLLKDHTTPAGK